MDRFAETSPGTEPVEVVSLDEHLADLAAARAGGREIPAGRLLGLPELPDGDVWVDSAGAAAVTGIAPRTITGYLSRRTPAGNPFPAPHSFLRRNFWPLSTIDAWTAAQARNRR